MEDKTKNSPFKAVEAVAAKTAITVSPQLIAAGASLLSGLFGSRRRKRQQRAAQKQYEEMRAAYEGLDTSNIYADVQNPYMGMENTMEDLRVNTQQADFIAQQGAQARADILGSFRNVAGGSGIASLAQSLANQQTQQAAQISASIGQQEAANERARAIQAGKLQELERRGEAQAESMRLGGEAQSRALEYQKTGTMFGMSQQRLAGANQAVAQGQAQMAAGIGGLAAGFASGQFGDLFGGAQAATGGASLLPNNYQLGDLNAPAFESQFGINPNFNNNLSYTLDPFGRKKFKDLSNLTIG